MVRYFVNVDYKDEITMKLWKHELIFEVKFYWTSLNSSMIYIQIAELNTE